MNSPRIRHLVQPTMSAADRTVSITNEVRIMTSAAYPLRRTRRRGIEWLVSRLAVGMLRWSSRRSARSRVTHEQMLLLRHVQRETASAIDMARLSRLG